MTDHVQASGPRPSDRYIPLYFVAFFLVVIAVNAVFLTFAVNSHSGLARDDAYRHGLAYNDIIAADEAQAALGWQASVQLAAGDRLAFTLKDRDGALIEGADVRVRGLFVAQEGFDLQVALEEVSAGLYEAAPDWPTSGQYDVIVDVTWQQQRFQHKARLIPGAAHGTRAD